MENIELAENKWQEILEKELAVEMSKATDVVSSHDLDHIKRVWRNVKKIANDMDVDWEVLIASVYLHDIGRHYPEGVREHGPISAIYAKQVLNRINFPTKKIPNIILSIKYHDETFPSEKRSTLEAKVLYCADKLDAFGYIGVSRYLIFNAMKGKTLQETVDYALESLPIKFQCLELEQAKIIAKDGYDYALDYFKNLNSEI